MSRAYRIALKESVVRTVRVEDGVKAALELLPVLARERMAELLGAELEKRGFRRDGQHAVRSDADGVEITVDLADASVTVRLGVEASVAREIERTATVPEERRQEGEAAARAQVRRELDQQVEAERGRMAAEVTARLERKLVDLRAELDAAVNRVTVEALKQRAAQLGHIEEIVSEEGGGVTIKVRL